MKIFSPQFWVIMSFIVLLGVASILITTNIEPEAIPPAPPHCVGVFVSDFKCQRSYLVAVTSRLGPEVALKTLRRIHEKNPAVLQSCHQLAHEIGNEVARGVTGERDIAKVFLGGDDICFSGYYHGVVEGYIQSHSKEIFASAMNKLCAATYSTSTPDRFDYFHCVHGMGHGVMAATHNRLFDSLKLCDKLLGRWERNSCYDGVFMENFIVYTQNKNHYGTEYLRPDDPLYPCNVVSEQYKVACYKLQSGAFYKNDGNTAQLFSTCRTAEPGYEDDCARSVGITIATLNPRNPHLVVSLCDMAKTDDEKYACYNGAVWIFVLFSNSKIEGEKFCSMTPARFSSFCKDAIQSAWEDLLPPTINKIEY